MTPTGPHIAVVDDEADARAMVGEYLRLHGFDVALCEGGRALRAHLQIRTPDLIVLDLNMPEEDGLSIVRDLKARSPIPIIMLTATASPIDRVVGLDGVPEGYRAMDRREALKVMVTPCAQTASAPGGACSLWPWVPVAWVGTCC